MSTLFRALPKTTTTSRLSTTSYLSATHRQTTRTFKTTPFIMVKAGDSIPDVDLNEGSPGDKVNLSKELSSGKGLIIGVPAAFSPGCSETHVPGYIASHKTQEFGGKVFVVSVNDAFVMKAWGKDLDPKGSSGIRFLADPKGNFVKALDAEFDASDLLGNRRAKRFAIITDGGKVKEANIEPDNIGIDVSSVEKVLG